MKLIIIAKHRAARAVRIRVTALIHETGDNAVKDGVAVIKPGGRQPLKHIHRVRSIFRKEHERHVAHVRHRHQPAPVGRGKRARRIRGRRLDNVQLPERIVRVQHNGDGIGAAGDRISQTPPIGGRGGDRDDQRLPGGNGHIGNGINHRRGRSRQRQRNKAQK